MTTKELISKIEKYQRDNNQTKLSKDDTGWMSNLEKMVINSSRIMNGDTFLHKTYLSGVQLAIVIGTYFCVF